MSRVVSARAKTTSRAKPPVAKTQLPKPEPVVSAKADPLSEDEFELDSKREAQEYAERASKETQRIKIKEENKERRAQGLALLRVPRRMKEKNKVQGYYSDEAEDLSGGEEASRKKRKRETEDEEPELEYEGQRKLPFDPLYDLAGVPNPIDRIRKDPVRDALLREYFGGEVGEASTSPGKATQAKMTVPNGFLVKKESEPSQPVLAAVSALKQETDPVRQEQAEEEEEEGGYPEEDEDVVAPWTTIPMVPSGGAGEDEEGVYSEDELFADTSQSLTQPSESVPQSQSILFSSSTIDIPATKPRFPYTETQAQIGPMPLDDTPGGVAVPAPINMFLKEYQRAGVKFMYGKYAQGRGGILGDDMGLGKTVQVIAFLAAIMRKTNTKEDHWRRKRLVRQSIEGSIPPKHWPTALIVVPSSLIRNWERELNAWGYFERLTLRSDTFSEVRSLFLKGFLDIILTSYDQLRTTVEHIKDLPISVVIADEAHRLKEPQAGRTLTIKKIRCTSCFALTGTLIQNRMDEMWSILDFVQRGWAGTLSEWRDFAVNPIKRGHRIDGTAAEVTLGIMRLGQLHQKLLPHFYLRRDKRLIAHELPEKKDLVVFCPLAERQILAYQRLVLSEDVQLILRRKEPCDCDSDLQRGQCCHKENRFGETVPQMVLKNITALQKVANHFGLLYHGKDDPPEMRRVNARIFETCASRSAAVLRRLSLDAQTGTAYDNKQENPAAAALDPANCGKWTLLARLLRQWRDESDKRNKVLIFSNSVRLLRMVYEFISTTFSGFSSQMFTGEASEGERMRMVDNFQDPEQDHFIMLISTQAGGVGLNLTAANKVVIFDPDWNPANDLQAMDRAFRIGQQRTVEVYRLIGLGTLEELKYERQIHKQQRSRQLNDGTFERRIHQGMDGAKNLEDQGELFGTHNLFRFDPKGFFAGNLERVQIAEDRFAQDLIDAEHDNENEDGPGPEEEEDNEARKMRRARRDQDMQRQARAAADKAKREDKRLVSDVLGDAEDKVASGGEDIFSKMGILAQVHDTAFRDSPAERQIYEIGLQLLKDNPALANTIKANDLGKLGIAKRRATATTGAAGSSGGGGGGTVGGSASAAARRMQTDPDDEPWQARFQHGRPKKGPRLIELSDEE